MTPALRVENILSSTHLLEPGIRAYMSFMRLCLGGAITALMTARDVNNRRQPYSPSTFWSTHNYLFEVSEKKQSMGGKRSRLKTLGASRNARPSAPTALVVWTVRVKFKEVQLYNDDNGDGTTTKRASRDPRIIYSIVPENTKMGDLMRYLENYTNVPVYLDGKHPEVMLDLDYAFGRTHATYSSSDMVMYNQPVSNRCNTDRRLEVSFRTDLRKDLYDAHLFERRQRDAKDAHAYQRRYSRNNNGYDLPQTI
mmetsp:Transcript_33296/g.81818  ORF Transcript_33296/g.81818 Transcript_33296/m.81818 type:complete len:253 (+) Transcript_33296:1597-2355(+)